MEAYRWVLALHVMAIISWMAGILYLYRLLVYASEQGYENAEIHKLLSIMSQRLYKYITLPAMIVAWLLGISMISLDPNLLLLHWLAIKLGLVLLLTASTFYAGALSQRYAGKVGPLPSSKQLRVLNEGPTMLMIGIVIMVIVRPF